MDGEQKIWLIWVAFITTLIVSGCIQQGEQERTGEKPQTIIKEVDIPIYSGSEVYSAPMFFYQMIGIPTEGIEVKIYYAEDATVNELLSWYKEKIKDYELVEEMPIVSISTPQGSMEWGAVLFQKDDQALGIWAMGGMAVEGGKGVVYYIVKGPIEKLIGEEIVGEKEQLPLGDVVSGEEPIPRYPNSVMLSHEKYDSYITITYGTKDDINSVFNWYKDYLSSNNWEIRSEGKEADRLSLEANKGEETIGIIIYAPYDVRDYTEINVHYGIQEETPPLTPVTPASDFGEKFDEFMKDVLGSVLGEAVLTSYFEWGGVVMEYSLASPVEDASAAAGGIKTELVKKGVPEQIIMVDISAGQATVSVMSWEFFGRTGTLNINIYEGSEKLDVSFVMIPGGSWD